MNLKNVTRFEVIDHRPNSDSYGKLLSLHNVYIEKDL